MWIMVTEPFPRIPQAKSPLLSKPLSCQVSCRALEDSLQSVDFPRVTAATQPPFQEWHGGTRHHRTDPKEQSPHAFLPRKLTSRWPDILRKSTEAAEKLLSIILRSVKPGPRKEGQSRVVSWS